MFSFLKKKNIPENHFILTEKSTIDVDPIKALRPGHISVIGGAGCGKGRNVIMPNLLQMYGSYIVSDAGGVFYADTADLFAKNGYNVQPLNLMKPDLSVKYNPLEYVFGENDAEKMASIILGKPDNDRFFYDCAKMLLISMLMVTRELHDEQEWFLRDIYNMCDNYETYVSFVEKAKRIQTVSVAWEYYNQLSITKKSFIISIMSTIKENLSIFCNSKYSDIFSSNEIKLNDVSSKNIIYIILPMTSECNKIVSLLYQQSIDVISGVKNMFFTMGKEFDYKLTLIMDEFANTIAIPQFYKLIGSCPKNINCIIAIQSIRQLKTLYPNDWEYIASMFNATIYLGRSDFETIDFVAQLANGLSITDIKQIQDSKCVLLLNGTGWSIENKYQLEKHPNATDKT